MKMDDPEVIRAALDRVRPRRRAHAGARPGAGRQGQAARQHGSAVERGTFGIPTFFVGKEIFFGKDKLRDVEDEIEAAKKSG